MYRAIFKNEKTGRHYVRINDCLFSVVFPKEYKPDYKVDKNGKEYFVENIELMSNKENFCYFYVKK